jgi:hypothetical protein
MFNALTRNPLVRLGYCMNIDYGGRSEGVNDCMIDYWKECGWIGRSMDDGWMHGGWM